MINIEIIDSQNLDYLGSYVIYKNNITLGNSSKNNILLSDEVIGNKVMSLKISDDKILVNSSSYISNGKKVSGTKVHDKESIIKFGNTEFKVIDFKPSIDNTDLNQVFQEKCKSSPYIEDIVLEIKKELIRIEREPNA